MSSHWKWVCQICEEEFPHDAEASRYNMSGGGPGSLLDQHAYDHLAERGDDISLYRQLERGELPFDEVEVKEAYDA